MNYQENHTMLDIECVNEMTVSQKSIVENVISKEGQGCLKDTRTKHMNITLRRYQKVK